MLCKSENRDPAHCLKEGRRVTRCAQDLYVFLTRPFLFWLLTWHLDRSPFPRITKLRENCLAEFDKHWNCLEYNNQVSPLITVSGTPPSHFLRYGRGADLHRMTHDTPHRNTTTAERTSAYSTSACLRSW